MKPPPSCYSGTILKRLVIFLRRVELFTFNWHAARKKNVFSAWKASLKLGGSCGVREQAMANSLLSGCFAKVTAVCQMSYKEFTEEGWSFLTFSRDAAREIINVLATLKLVEAVVFVNRLWLAHCHLPRKGSHRPLRKGTVLKLTTIRFLNRLRSSNC